MRNIRISIIAALVLTLGSFGLFSSVQAAAPANDPYGLYAAANTAKLAGKKIAGYDNISGAIGGFIKIGLGALGILFFFLVLYAGFLWMTSMGNTESVEKAKGIIEGAAIGLILVVGSYAIATFVLDSLESGAQDSSPASPTTQGKCTVGVQVDGDICDLNSRCVTVNRNDVETLECLSECETKYEGTCGTRASCADQNNIELNLCPGGNNNVCCK